MWEAHLLSYPFSHSVLQGACSLKSTYVFTLWPLEAPQLVNLYLRTSHTLKILLHI